MDRKIVEGRAAYDARCGQVGIQNDSLLAMSLQDRTGRLVRLVGLDVFHTEALIFFGEPKDRCKFQDELKNLDLEEKACCWRLAVHQGRMCEHRRSRHVYTTLALHCTLVCGYVEHA